MVKRAGLDMPEFAADADRFRPERWLEESGAPVKKEPKGFMPFGQGPRKCLGMLLAKMEMRVWSISCPLLCTLQTAIPVCVH